MADELLMRPRARYDFKEEGELDAIAEAVREAVPELEVSVEDARSPTYDGRKGINVNEILDLFFSGAADYVISTAANAAVRTARALWKKRQEKGPTRRPKTVVIYGPDGKQLTSVRVDEDEADDFDLSRIKRPDDDEPDAGA